MKLHKSITHWRTIKWFKTLKSRFKAIHKDTSYHRSVVKGSQDKIKIKCKTCKEYYWQRPNDHLQGKGCPKCGAKKSIKARTMTQEEFVTKAREVHGDDYIYESEEYVNNRTPIPMTHKICNHDFLQSPNNHLSGNGCPKCGAINSLTTKAKNSKHFDSYKVYLVKLESEDEEFYKVGVTFRVIEGRLKQFRESHYHPTLLHLIKVNSPTEAIHLEEKIIAKHKKHKYKPLHLKSGDSECFTKLRSKRIINKLLSKAPYENL